MKKQLIKCLKIGFAALIFVGLVFVYMPQSYGNTRPDDPPGGTGTVPMPKPPPPTKLTDDPPGGTGTVPMPKPPPPTR